MRSPGWRYESRRHALSARGIRSYRSRRLRGLRVGEFRGYKVREVPEGVLHDYAGMNPEAAKRIGFKDIGEYEVLVNESVHDGERLRTIVHETTEANLMRKGLPYWQAHVLALNAEKGVR